MRAIAVLFAILLLTLTASAECDIGQQCGSGPNFPYIRDLRFYNTGDIEITTPIDIGSIAKPWVQVRNPSAAGYVVKVQLVIDRDNLPPYDYSTLSSQYIIQANDQRSFNLPNFVPQVGGTYHANLTITGGPGGYNNFVLASQQAQNRLTVNSPASFNFTIQNIAGGNTAVPGNHSIVEVLHVNGANHVPLGDQFKRQPINGQTSWDNLDGNKEHVFEVYVEEPGTANLHQQGEFWGAVQGFPGGNLGNDYTFVRNRPVAVDVTFGDQTSAVSKGDSLVVGSQVSPIVHLKNYFGADQDVIVTVVMDRDGIPGWDTAVNSTQVTLAAGATGQVAVPLTLEAIGAYQLGLIVYTKVNGKFIPTDKWGFAHFLSTYSYNNPALYVWSIGNQLIKNGDTDRQKFYSVIDDMGFKTIYIATDYYKGTAQQQTQLSDFIQQLKTGRSVEIHVMTGDGTDVLPPNNLSFHSRMQKILDFNARHPGKFDGIHFDIEMHEGVNNYYNNTFGVLPNYTQLFLQDYHRLLIGIKSRNYTLSSGNSTTWYAQNLSLSLDAQVFWGDKDKVSNWTHLISLPDVDYVTIMAYNKEIAGVLNRVKNIIDHDPKKPFVVPIEAQEFSYGVDDGASYSYTDTNGACTLIKCKHEEGDATIYPFLQSRLGYEKRTQEMDSTFSGLYPGYLGYAAHFYENPVTLWYALQNISVAANTAKQDDDVEVSVSIETFDRFSTRQYHLAALWKPKNQAVNLDDLRFDSVIRKRDIVLSGYENQRHTIQVPAPQSLGDHDLVVALIDADYNIRPKNWNLFEGENRKYDRKSLLPPRRKRHVGGTNEYVVIDYEILNSSLTVTQTAKPLPTGAFTLPYWFNQIGNYVIELLGTNLATATVTFPGNQAGTIVSQTDDKIQVSVPALTTSGEITISNTEGSSTVNLIVEKNFETIPSQPVPDTSTTLRVPYVITNTCDSVQQTSLEIHNNTIHAYMTVGRPPFTACLALYNPHPVYGIFNLGNLSVGNYTVISHVNHAYYGQGSFQVKNYTGPTIATVNQFSNGTIVVLGNGFSNLSAFIGSDSASVLLSNQTYAVITPSSAFSSGQLLLRTNGGERNATHINALVPPLTAGVRPHFYFPQGPFSQTTNISFRIGASSNSPCFRVFSQSWFRFGNTIITNFTAAVPGFPYLCIAEHFPHTKYGLFDLGTLEPGNYTLLLPTSTTTYKHEFTVKENVYSRNDIVFSNQTIPSSVHFASQTQVVGGGRQVIYGSGPQVVSFLDGIGSFYPGRTYRVRVQYKGVPGMQAQMTLRSVRGYPNSRVAVGEATTSWQYLDMMHTHTGESVMGVSLYAKNPGDVITFRDLEIVEVIDSLDPNELYMYPTSLPSFSVSKSVLSTSNGTISFLLNVTANTSVSNVYLYEQYNTSSLQLTATSSLINYSVAENHSGALLTLRNFNKSALLVLNFTGNGSGWNNVSLTFLNHTRSQSAVWYNVTPPAMVSHVAAGGGGGGINTSLSSGIMYVPGLRIPFTLFENRSLSLAINNESTKLLCLDCSQYSGHLSFFSFGNHTLQFFSDNESLLNLSLLLVKDRNRNGIADYLEMDTDGDGVNDTDESLLGNLSHIGTDLSLGLMIGNNSNLSRIIQNTQPVTFMHNGSTLFEFSFDFNASMNRTLDLAEVVVQKQETNATKGMVLIRGLDLAAQNKTKTVYVDKMNTSSNAVCIIDEPITTVVEGSCTSSILCDGGQYGAYRCTDLGSQFRISGLSHSFVEESSLQASTSSVQQSNRGGGGGSSSSKAPVVSIPKVVKKTKRQPIIVPTVIKEEPRSVTIPVESVLEEEQPTPQPVEKEEFWHWYTALVAALSYFSLMLASLYYII